MELAEEARSEIGGEGQQAFDLIRSYPHLAEELRAVISRLYIEALKMEAGAQKARADSLVSENERRRNSEGSNLYHRPSKVFNLTPSRANLKGNNGHTVEEGEMLTVEEMNGVFTEAVTKVSDDTQQQDAREIQRAYFAGEIHQSEALGRIRRLAGLEVEDAVENQEDQDAAEESAPRDDQGRFTKEEVQRADNLRRMYPSMAD